MENLSREEFERHFFLFSEKKIHIPENVIHSMDSLKRVKFLPNGRIDFLSVDELARCLVNTMSFDFTKINSDSDD